MLIKALSWNAQSLNNKISELSQFIEQNDIKIALISETWFRPNSTYNLSNFSIYRADRLVNHNRGGVCVIIHNSISHTFVKNISLDYAEAAFVKIHTVRGDITVGSVYCSPAAHLSQAKLFFSQVLNITGSSITAGDFNSKHQSWNNYSKACPKGKVLFDLCSTRKFSIHPPDGPTLEPSNGKPSIVDFVISKSVLGVSNPRVNTNLSSDHRPILFNFPIDSSAFKDIRIHNFRKADYNKFRSHMTEESIKINNEFSSLDNPQRIDECIERMERSTHEAVEKAIPKKLPYKFSFAMNKELQTLIRARNRYRNLFLRTGDLHYKSVKNLLNRRVKIITAMINQKSFDEKIRSLNTRDRSLYQFLKYLKNKNSPVPPLVKLDSTLAYSNQDKADTLAAAFLKCHQTSQNMPSPHEAKVKKSKDNVSKTAISISKDEEIRVSEVEGVISYLNPRKAPGPDKIGNLVIKKFPKCSIALITRVFNHCLKLSYFPIAWKIARVVAFPKPGKNNSNPMNYRPISLLSNIGKIFEKLVLERLKSHEEDKKIFIPNQFGFRNYHSTIHQVLRITEKATKNFNLKKSTGMVLLDIEKAFDSVWHDGLIHKLNKLQFPLYLTKLMQSYLQDRKASVAFRDSTSDPYNIPAGVPQGSILAPFLFNVFINDIKQPKNSELAIFADDTAQTAESTLGNLPCLKKRLVSDFTRTRDFFASWKIKINNSKTEFIVFSKSHKMIKKAKEDEIEIDNEKFKWLDSVRYLGVHLDSTLNYKTHIDTVIAKAKKIISILFCVLKKNSTLNAHSKVFIYKTYIRPILTYAGTIFHNCPKTYFGRLQILQNKCLRMALNVPYYSRNADNHQSAAIPTIEEFIQKNADRFYDKLKSHNNDLINKLGDYNINSLPFKLVHKLPKKI